MHRYTHSSTQTERPNGHDLASNGNTQPRGDVSEQHDGDHTYNQQASTTNQAKYNYGYDPTYYQEATVDGARVIIPLTPLEEATPVLLPAAPYIQSLTGLLPNTVAPMASIFCNIAPLVHPFDLNTIMPVKRRDYMKCAHMFLAQELLQRFGTSMVISSRSAILNYSNLNDGGTNEEGNGSCDIVSTVPYIPPRKTLREVAFEVGATVAADLADREYCLQRMGWDIVMLIRHVTAANHCSRGRPSSPSDTSSPSAHSPSRCSGTNTPTNTLHDLDAADEGDLARPIDSLQRAPWLHDLHTWGPLAWSLGCQAVKWSVLRSVAARLPQLSDKALTDFCVERSVMEAAEREGEVESDASTVVAAACPVEAHAGLEESCVKTAADVAAAQECRTACRNGSGKLTRVNGGAGMRGAGDGDETAKGGKCGKQRSGQEQKSRGRLEVAHGHEAVVGDGSDGT